MTQREHGRMLLLAGTALLVAILTGCSMPTTADVPIPPSTIDPVVESWFVQAGEDLIQRDGFSADIIHSIGPEKFTFRAVDGKFDCGGVKQTAGCFSDSKRLIRYTIGHEYTVRHEAKHAILWALGDDRWRCVEHTCLSMPNWD